MQRYKERGEEERVRENMVVVDTVVVIVVLSNVSTHI